jgi:predicted ATP-grasp superfamily ATP-dependent carboligase
MRIALRSGSWLLACLMCGTVQAQSCSSLELANWLVGEWRGTRGENQILERWQKISAETFEGMGTTRRGANVVESETLRLVAMEQRVFYVAKVAHNDLPVAFALTQCEDQRLVFENPAHDFPKKLEYHLTGPDTLSVRVSAGERGFTLTFNRQKT